MPFGSIPANMPDASPDNDKQGDSEPRDACSILELVASLSTSENLVGKPQTSIRAL